MMYFNDRNKFLTEAMGYELYLGLVGYVHPSKPYFEFTEPIEGINFSSWVGFGKLYPWAINQDWWIDFEIENETITKWKDLVNPDVFANAVYEYLLSKEISK